MALKYTTGAIYLPPRIILVGVPKIGKSEWAAGAPSPIFMPISGEKGIDEIDVAKFDVATSFEQVLDNIKELLNDKDHQFKTLVIDSVSTLDIVLQQSAMRHENVKTASKLGGGYGRQYDTILSFWVRITKGLDLLREKRGMQTILIGHTEIKSFDDPERESYSVYEMDVNKPSRNLLYRWCDSILFANTRTVVKNTDNPMQKNKASSSASRFLFTQKSPNYPVGGRGIYGHLPPRIELSYAAFAEAVRAAKAAKTTPKANVDKT